MSEKRVNNRKTPSPSLAIGGFFILLPLVILLAPFTPLKAMGYGVMWLFGLPFFWVYQPLLMILGILFLLKGMGLHVKFGNWMTYLGFICLYLGFAIFLSNNQYKGGDVSYIEATSSLLFPDTLRVLDERFAGGIVGYGLYRLFAMAGEALVIASFVFLWVLGAFLLLYPIIRYFAKGLGKRTKGAAKKEKKAPYSDSGFEPLPVLHPEAYESDKDDEPPFIMSDLSEETSPTFATKELPVRSALVDHSIEGIPVEIKDERKAPKTRKLSTSGLQEASFSFDDDDPEDYVSYEGKPNTEAKVEVKNDDPFISMTPSLQKEPSHIEEATKNEEIPEVKEEPLPEMPSSKNVAFEEETPMVEEEPLIEEPLAFVEPEPEPEPLPEIKPEPEPIVEEIAPMPKEEAKPEPVKKEEPLPKKKDKKPFVYLDNRLLKTYDNSNKKAQLELDCARKLDMLNEVYEGLRAGAKVVGYTVGPTVTRFNIQPDPSVPVSKLNQYTKNLSMRLSGASVRFEEVVPGEMTAGLEVPNPRELSSSVSFKDTFDHLPERQGHEMYVPFGMTISGDYLSADYAEFPHMLVAGGTGSGKSVFIQGIITTLIMRNSPEELRLVIVDPKKVDFVSYRDIPHLLCPIVEDGSQARICLQKLCEEMDKRYTEMRLAGVNKIERYNEEYAIPQDLPRMPRILCIIDEFGDLMDTNKDCADSVVRLAQKARAVGIHLLIATQRPTVDVISGRIKGNIATRVALMVKSAIDSQTILNVAGAESLIGKGDMLVDCAGVSQHALVRCQGCFLSPSEIDAICKSLRDQQEVEYDPNFLDLVDHEAEKNERESQEVEIDKAALQAKAKDDFYRELVKVVMQEEYTSISKIQRNFGVGFPRAGKLMAQLQKDGIVAKTTDTPTSSKGFRVLIHNESELPPSLFPKENEA